MTRTPRQLSRYSRRAFRWGLVVGGLLVAALVTAALVVLGGFGTASPLWIGVAVPAAFVAWLLGIIAGFLFGLDANVARGTDRRRD